MIKNFKNKFGDHKNTVIVVGDFDKGSNNMNNSYGKTKSNKELKFSTTSNSIINEITQVLENNKIIHIRNLLYE
jgi:ribosomal protein S19E (S16A)